MKPTHRSERVLARLAASVLMASASKAYSQSIFTVTTTSDGSGAATTVGTLRYAITQANLNPGSTINFDNNLGTIALGGELPFIDSSVTINGGTGNTVSGADAYRVFFVNAGTVNISNLQIANGDAHGGNGGIAWGAGGGGGLGAGGGLYVRAGSVALDNVSFSNNQAVGGNGGASPAVLNSFASNSGGGGLGGNGGSGGNTTTNVTPGLGGGGAHVVDVGGNTATTTGGVGGGPAGGAGGAEGTSGSTGGDLSGGGGAGDGTELINGGGGGYGGGGGGGGAMGPGGNGGFGGGGGGGGNALNVNSFSGQGGGNGGFGGGGGGGAGFQTQVAGGAGGFGAGTGGFANANSNDTVERGGGGGGAGLGGAVFVASGASLTVQDGGFQSDTVAGGLGGAGNNGNSPETGGIEQGGGGQAYGQGLFLNGSTVNFDVSPGNTLAINDSLAAATSTISDSGSVVMNGPGTLVLGGNNQYGGGTTINGGTLAISSASNLGSGAITLNGGTLQLGGGNNVGTLDVRGNVLLAVPENQAATAGLVNIQTTSLAFSGPGTLSLFNVGKSIGTSFPHIPLTVNGPLQLGTILTVGSLNGSGPSITNAGDGELVLDGSDNGEYGGTLNDQPKSSNGEFVPFNMTMMGTGTQILDQGVAFTGQLSVFSGTLQLGNGGSNVQCAALDIVDATSVIFDAANSLTVSSGFEPLTTFNGTVTLTQVGTLTQNGGGTLTLTSSNSFTSVSINDGVLAAHGASNISSEVNFGGGALEFLGGATGSIKFSGNAVVFVASGQTAAGALTLGPGATLTFNGPGALVDSQSINQATPLTVNGGTLQLNGPSLIQGLNGSGGSVASVNAIDVGENNANGSFLGDLISALGEGTPQSYTFDKVGSGTQSLGGSNTFFGTMEVDGGKLLLQSPQAMSPNADLIVNPGGQLQLAAGGGDYAAPMLTVTGTGVFDVADNTLAIDYGVGNPSPLSAIKADITSGYNVGKWNGPGIDSSVAAAGNGAYAIGYADGNSDSDTVASAGQVLIKYTLVGDANLDGTVNLTDLLSLLNGYSQTGRDWAEGDFNYDGSVNLTDLLSLLNNYGQTATTTSVDSTAVPEPCLAGWAMAAWVLSRRRRRGYKIIAAKRDFG